MIDPLDAAEPRGGAPCGIGDAVRNAYRLMPADLPDDMARLLRRLN